MTVEKLANNSIDVSELHPAGRLKGDTMPLRRPPALVALPILRATGGPAVQGIGWLLLPDLLREPNL